MIVRRRPSFLRSALVLAMLAGTAAAQQPNREEALNDREVPLPRLLPAPAAIHPSTLQREGHRQQQQSRQPAKLGPNRLEPNWKRTPPSPANPLRENSLRSNQPRPSQTQQEGGWRGRVGVVPASQLTATAEESQPALRRAENAETLPLAPPRRPAPRTAGPPSAQADALPGAAGQPRLARQPRVKMLGDRRAQCPSPDELQEWFKPLSEINVSSKPSEGELPIDCSTNLFFRAEMYEQGVPVTRQWAETEFNWQASELAHQPLYWDDVPLERYGQTIHPAIQPFISGARFFGTFPVVPYKIGIDRTHDLVYTLGLYRPGSPTPRVMQILPLELDATFIESGAWIGLIFLLP